MTVHIGGRAQYPKLAFPSTAEFQALLNGGEKLITFGQGTYDLDAGVTIPAGVTVRGDGAEATILRYNDAAAVATLITLAANAHLENLAVAVAGGSGAVTDGVKSSGDGCVISDVKMNALILRLQNDLARVFRCEFVTGSASLVITGDSNLVTDNIFSALVRAIYINGGSKNIVKSSQIVGSGVSTRGIHLDGAGNFNQILHNLISGIALASPGVGIDLAATGASNKVGHNIFSGAFGVKAMRGVGSLPATTQFIGNQTIEVTPSSARFVAADLSGASGLSNT